MNLAKDPAALTQAAKLAAQGASLGSKGLSGLGSAVKGIKLSSVGSTLKKGLGAAGRGIKSGVGALRTVKVKNIAGAIGKGASVVGKGLKSGVSAIGSIKGRNITGAIGKGASYLGKGVKTGLSKIKSTRMSNITGAIKGAAGTAARGIKGVAGAAGTGIKSAFNKTRKALDPTRVPEGTPPGFKRELLTRKIKNNMGNTYDPDRGIIIKKGNDKNNLPYEQGQWYSCKGFKGTSVFEGEEYDDAKNKVVGTDIGSGRHNYDMTDCERTAAQNRPPEGFSKGWSGKYTDSEGNIWDPATNKVIAYGSSKSGQEVVPGNWYTCVGYTKTRNIMAEKVENGTLYGQDENQESGSFPAAKCIEYTGEQLDLPLDRNGKPMDTGNWYKCSGALGSSIVQADRYKGKGTVATLYGKDEDGYDHSYSTKSCVAATDPRAKTGTAAQEALAAVEAAEGGAPDADPEAAQAAVAAADEETVSMAAVAEEKRAANAEAPPVNVAANAAAEDEEEEPVKADLIAATPPPQIPEDLSEAFTAIEMVVNPEDENWPRVKKALRAAADDAKVLAVYKDDEMVQVGGRRRRVKSHKRSGGKRGRRRSMRKQRGGALDTYTVVFGKPGLDPAIVKENFEKILEKDPSLEGVVEDIMPDPVPVPPPPSREEMAAAAAAMGAEEEEGLLPAGPGNANTPANQRARNIGKAPANLNVEMKEMKRKPKPDGEPFRIEPGDYKGMMSKNKYFIYFDPFVQKKAANVLIRANSKGNYGFYRVTGTDQQIYDGIRALRGMTEGTIVNQIISNLTTKIKETEARLEATRSDIDIYEATPNSSTSKDNELQNLAKDEQEILSELDELKGRLDVAKQEKAQLESAAAGTF
jgi:hypothetical protein